MAWWVGEGPWEVDVTREESAEDGDVCGRRLDSERGPAAMRPTRGHQREEKGKTPTEAICPW